VGGEILIGPFDGVTDLGRGLGRREPRFCMTIWIVAALAGTAIAQETTNATIRRGRPGRM
jgi:hypothetical protein